MVADRAPLLAVAVVDTGVSEEHLAADAVRPGVNLCGEGLPDITVDDNGHGTAVADTILRATSAACIVPVKLMGQYGYPQSPEQLEFAFEWIRAHQHKLGIHVVCAAFADAGHLTSDELYRGSELQEHVAALRSCGVPTVAPAGNWFLHNRHWNPQGMAWPAILREVVSVGAVWRDPEGLLHLADSTQRLHRDVGGACYTTVFVEPGAPGGTSGAAAVVAGRLLTLRAVSPHAPVDELVADLLRGSGTARDDATSLEWPVATGCELG